MKRINSVVADNSKKFIFVYQTKNLVNGKTYIGIHGTNDLNDAYLGGGIYYGCPSTIKNRKTALASAVKKYGFENFVTIPLDYFDTYEEALEEESYLVTSLDVASQSNYNMVSGGGKTISRIVTEETRQRIREARAKQEVTENMKASLAEGRKMGPLAVSKKVFCEKNGKTYNSISACAKDLGIGTSTVHRYANGKVKSDLKITFI